MKKIRLQAAALEQKRKDLKLTKGKMAQKIGLSVPTLYRACLNPGDPLYNKPGERMVAAILTAFPEAKFEDFFILE